MPIMTDQHYRAFILVQRLYQSLAGIDVKTGKNLWRNKRPSKINWVSPITFTAGGTLGTGGNVRTLDVGTGSTLNLAGQSLSTAAGTT